jgi:hypothetical protein
MRPELTYSYYTANHGSLPKSDFNAALNQAVGLVDYITAAREVVASNQDAYLKAICAAVDAIHETDLYEPGTSSVSIGNFGQVYGITNALSGEEIATKAATLQLSRAVPSLLYGGIR